MRSGRKTILQIVTQIGDILTRITIYKIVLRFCQNLNLYIFILTKYKNNRLIKRH